MTDESERSPPRRGPGGVDGAVRARFDWESTSPSTAVVETLAVALDRPETTLDPLSGSVDPDALDALVHSTGPSTGGETVTVSFVYGGQRVTVHGTGEVVVRTADR